MKTTEKVIIAGLVGTSFMTLYSYFKAKKEKQEYVEPIMINKLIDNSENTPEIEDNDSHPAGWGLHCYRYCIYVGLLSALEKGT